jgi:hypothetical protein
MTLCKWLFIQVVILLRLKGIYKYSEYISLLQVYYYWIQFDLSSWVKFEFRPLFVCLHPIFTHFLNSNPLS